MQVRQGYCGGPSKSARQSLRKSVHSGGPDAGRITILATLISDPPIVAIANPGNRCPSSRPAR